VLALEDVPVKRRTLCGFDDPATIAAWASRMVRALDPTLPGQTVGTAGVVARILVDNAQRHGLPPVTVQVSVSSVVTVEVTDHGPDMPVARPDGTGSLAVILDALTSLWDVIEHEDGSKTVAAVVPIAEPPEVPRRRRKAKR
jgi:hypothetical protein